jgi:hypothetical protein
MHLQLVLRRGHYQRGQGDLLRTCCMPVIRFCVYLVSATASRRPWHTKVWVGSVRSFEPCPELPLTVIWSASGCEIAQESPFIGVGVGAAAPPRFEASALGEVCSVLPQFLLFARRVG